MIAKHNWSYILVLQVHRRIFQIIHVFEKITWNWRKCSCLKFYVQTDQSLTSTCIILFQCAWQGFVISRCACTWLLTSLLAVQSTWPRLYPVHWFLVFGPNVLLMFHYYFFSGKLDILCEITLTLCNYMYFNYK